MINRTSRSQSTLTSFFDRRSNMEKDGGISSQYVSMLVS